MIGLLLSLLAMGFIMILFAIAARWAC